MAEAAKALSRAVEGEPASTQDRPVFVLQRQREVGAAEALAVLEAVLRTATGNRGAMSGFGGLGRSA